MQSENINEIAEALAAAQGEITGALKDSANPFFKSKYADLASVWDACRASLSKHGLSVIQTTDDGGKVPATVTVRQGDKEKVTQTEFTQLVLHTTLAHKSGQWIRGKLVMTPLEPTPQAIGSCLTYMRRYGLAAMVGVAQVDDDANHASGRQAA